MSNKTIIDNIKKLPLNLEKKILGNKWGVCRQNANNSNLLNPKVNRLECEADCIEFGNKVREKGYILNNHEYRYKEDVALNIVKHNGLELKNLTDKFKNMKF